MFDLGMSEILMIVIVAIIIFKPEDLPHIIRKVAIFFVSIKAFCAELTKEISEIKDEVDVTKAVAGQIEDLEGEMREVYDVSDLDEFANLEVQEEVKKEDKSA